MSDFICHLKLPFAVVSVITIVWYTAQYAEPPDSYPPLSPNLYQQNYAGRADKQRWIKPAEGSFHEEPRVELEP